MKNCPAARAIRDSPGEEHRRDLPRDDGKETREGGTNDIGLPDEYWTDVEAGTEALVDQWLGKEGDRVSATQVIARVGLVKTTLDGAAPANGVIDRILVPAEQTFAKGKPIGTIREG